jgi:hypothetical protein
MFWWPRKKIEEDNVINVTTAYTIEPFVDHGKKFYKIYSVTYSICGPFTSPILEIFETREEAEKYIRSRDE